MRASLIQIAVNEGESVSSRRTRVAELVREQAGSDLVVLPELWPVGAFAYEQFETEAEPLDGPTYEAMSKAARDAGVWLHAGSVVERAGDGSSTTPPSSCPRRASWPPPTARSTASASTRARRS